MNKRKFLKALLGTLAAIPILVKADEKWVKMKEFPEPEIKPVLNKEDFSDADGLLKMNDKVYVVKDKTLWVIGESTIEYTGPVDRFNKIKSFKEELSHIPKMRDDFLLGKL